MNFRNLFAVVAVSSVLLCGPVWAEKSAPGSERAFNPQPEPPRDGLVRTPRFHPDLTRQPKNMISNPTATKGFNPQPDPPGKTQAGPTAPGSSRSFNPQPEPPKQAPPKSL